LGDNKWSNCSLGGHWNCCSCFSSFDHSIFVSMAKKEENYVERAAQNHHHPCFEYWRGFRATISLNPLIIFHPFPPRTTWTTLRDSRSTLRWLRRLSEDFYLRAACRDFVSNLWQATSSLASLTNIGGNISSLATRPSRVLVVSE